MGNNNTRAGDYTGTLKAQLAKDNAEKQQAAAAGMALATASIAPENLEPVDLEPKQPEVENNDPMDAVNKFEGDEDGVQRTRDVDVSEEKKSFRVNETLENVTIGHGNHYDFEEGRTYTASKRIYDHLEEKGLIWH